MRKWWYRIQHWEFWPVHLIYAPAFFYWISMMIKFRSFHFYKYANPGIRNGGLYGDSKMEIYQLLDPTLYPKTIRIEYKQTYDFPTLLAEQQLRFPLILKPDIGQRGLDVEKVDSVKEIEHYYLTKKSNFLIQEFIDLPGEIGLFYCRIPNEKNGRISGLTLKNFLTVEGNGIETIEQLLNKNNRHEMQISTLKDNINLNEILPLHEKRILVEFGNHSRGTEFLDGNAFLSDKLNKTFNSILNAVNGFYYGRLDIRYNTFEELERGENFSIIELNGVKSEPTHIYDPQHSFWYGQKEIFRHQQILHHIVKGNIGSIRANPYSMYSGRPSPVTPLEV
jgi:hypothetical protein